MTSSTEQPVDARKNGSKKKARGTVFVDDERCKGCAICAEFCPTNALQMSDRFNSKGYHPPELSEPEECTGCELCGLYCPDFAIYSVRIKKK